MKVRPSIKVRCENCKIKNAPLPESFYETLLQALQSSFIYDRLIISWVNELPQPELAVTVTPHRIGATVRVTARRFARAVWLSTPEGEGAFSDNFFDLLPGEAATVEWTPGSAARPGAAERLSTVLRATTVRDTY